MLGGLKPAQSGGTILDIATETGTIAFYAANLVGPHQNMLAMELLVFLLIHSCIIANS